MSYSIKFRDDKKFPNYSHYQIQRNDGIWKDSPHFVLPKKYTSQLDVLKDFQVYPDDIWLVGFFKTGTTVGKELIWLLMNDLDFETAKSVGLSKRVPYYE